jgi:hypothetical protein
LALRLDVQNGIAYLASGGMDVEDEDWDLGEAAPEEAGLLIVDVHDPAMPVVLAHLLTPGEATGVQVRGDYAYVADAWNFLVVDVSDPTHPLIAGRLTNEDWWLQDIALAGDRAYLTDGVGHIIIVDITDVTAPRHVATVSSQGAPQTLLIGNGALYVGLANESDDPDASTGGLEVFDLRNPDEPGRTSILDLGGEVWGLALDGTTLYATDREGGIWTLDVSASTQAQIVSFTPTSGYSFGVAVTDTALFVADYTSLTVLSKGEQPSPICEIAGSDKIISGSELIAAIQRYAAGGLSGPQLIQIIQYYASGTACDRPLPGASAAPASRQCPSPCGGGGL